MSPPLLTPSLLFQINDSYLKRIPVERDSSGSTHANRRVPVITTSGLELEIDGKTFQGGKARLSCVATVFNLYRREKEVVLEEERPRPRPSSVLGTRDAASGRYRERERMLLKWRRIKVESFMLPMYSLSSVIFLQYPWKIKFLFWI